MSDPYLKLGHLVRFNLALVGEYSARTVIVRPRSWWRFHPCARRWFLPQCASR